VQETRQKDHCSGLATITKRLVKGPIKVFEPTFTLSDLFDIESECGKAEGFYVDSASVKSSSKLRHLYSASTSHVCQRQVLLSLSTSFH
jgi:hypothetical protein